MIRKFILLLCLTAGTFAGFAQKSYNEQVQDYIAKFKDLAMQEQQRTGIPASITLAQGIFETAAGSSELCTNASNHFGIKCKSTWTGETYTYTDDAKDECFRKYSSAIHSYKDHSDFLKTNQRYSLLFNLSPTDYASWAYGLKRCGYATNPQYAKKLIKFIEDYKLQEYTYAALGNNGEDILLASAQEKMIPRSKTVSTVVPGENIPVNDAYTTGNNLAQTSNTTEEEEEIFVEKASQQEQQSKGNVTEYYQTATKNGLSGFYAKKGDMLLEYAIKNKIRYAKLLEMNDLPDAPLEADMFVYLNRKAKAGKASTHTVEDGESLLQISQDEGIQLQQLRAYNHLGKGEEPVPGTVLNLQAMADGAPQVYTSFATKKANNETYRRATSSNDGYVTAGKKEETAREVIIDDTELVPTPVKTERVNIADETPVEEVIAREQNAVQERKPAQMTKKEESKMSALDKLKAHMDKTVYASNQEFEPKASGNYDEQPVATAEEEVVTTPARRNNAVSVKETRAAEKKAKETAGKKEVLKSKAKVKVKSHTVKRGETLFEIAEKYDITVSQLQKMNKINSKKIQPGMKLKVAK